MAKRGVRKRNVKNRRPGVLPPLVTPVSAGDADPAVPAQGGPPAAVDLSSGGLTEYRWTVRVGCQGGSPDLGSAAPAVGLSQSEPRHLAGRVGEVPGFLGLFAGESRSEE